MGTQRDITMRLNRADIYSPIFPHELDLKLKKRWEQLSGQSLE